METSKDKEHLLSIKNRESITATGVNRIEFFSPEAVLLHTVRGHMAIKGVNLFVDSLNSETSQVFIKGEINSIAYSKDGEGKSWLKRLMG